MSEADERPVSPVDAYALLARAFDTIIVHRKHASGDELAKLAVETLGLHGLTVYQAEGPKVRQATAINEARKLLRESKTQFARTGANAACASALQGILVVMTEQLESQWDTPCDCFAGLPHIDCELGLDRVYSGPFEDIPESEKP
jgi:hypothetical protein